MTHRQTDVYVILTSTEITFFLGLGQSCRGMIINLTTLMEQDLFCSAIKNKQLNYNAFSFFEQIIYKELICVVIQMSVLRYVANTLKNYILLW